MNIIARISIDVDLDRNPSYIEIDKQRYPNLFC